MEGKELDIKVIPTPDTKIKDKEKSENPKTKKGYPEPQSSWKSSRIKNLKSKILFRGI